MSHEKTSIEVLRKRHRFTWVVLSQVLSTKPDSPLREEQRTRFMRCWDVMCDATSRADGPWFGTFLERYDAVTAHFKGRGTQLLPREWWT